MSSQDKEKIKELNKKIKDLESLMTQKNQSLQDYQDIERIADEKIKGLSAIHSEKIRSLMNSVQLLKKENASLSKGTKEHKRSEFIQQLNKEIGDQDVVIDVLRGLVGDQKRADAAIIQTLSKGPARIRVQTREELKMELKDLKAKLLKFEKKKANGTLVADENQEPSQMNSIISIKGAPTDAKVGSGNAEYIMRINELNNQIEDLHLQSSGKQMEIDKYKQLITKKNQEIIELTQAKIDLKFMMTKNEELKNEVETLRQKLNSDIYTNYDQQIKLEELELAATVHKNLQNKTSEAIKLEFETLQGRLTGVINQNKQLLVQNTKTKDENLSMRKLLDDAKERNRKLHSEHEEQVSKLASASKEKDNNIKALNLRMKDYEDQFDKLAMEVKDKETLISDLEERIQGLEQEIDNLKENGGSQNALDNSAIEAANKELEAKKYEMEIEINHYKQEVFRLRERVKELTLSEIELSDRIDVLEQENRFLNKKVIAANLIVKEQYNDTMTPQEVQTHVKELSTRYEARIKDMTRKVKELEARNKDLEEIQNIMNNPSSNALTGSVALTDTDQDI